MEQITLKDFKEHKFFIALTVIVSILLVATYVTAASQNEPAYMDFSISLIAAIVFMPVYALWFKYFWNIVVRKITNVKPISYGVAFLLTACLSWIIG